MTAERRFIACALVALAILICACEAASGAESIAKRVATLAYGKIDDAPTRQLIGRFDFAVLNMWPGMSVSYRQKFIDDIKQANPNIKLAQYIILNEWSGNNSVPSDVVWEKITNSSWWTRDSLGNRVQWTDIYGNYEVDLTTWATPDSNGLRWPQWKANYDTDTMFSLLTKLDYVFNDNVFHQPWVDADFKHIGTNQSRNDPDIMTAYRQGYVSYWNTFRARNPGLKIIGNVDSDLNYPEFQFRLEGAFLECLVGKSWSIETWAGWDKMMERYRATLTNTSAPHAVIFQACSPTTTANLTVLRYGFASALLEDGYYAYSVNYAKPLWFDEFSAPLGTPAEQPPRSPAANGVWMRHYTNGLVLVNPTDSLVTIDVGVGYKRLNGTQDPVVNNGQSESVVTLPSKSGLLMIKEEEDNGGGGDGGAASAELASMVVSERG